MSLRTEEVAGFKRRAREYGLDLTRGFYGEWKSPETRQAWFFWTTGWSRRAAVEKKRRASSTSSVSPEGQP